jgi:DNA-binding response OmpR family regulator
MGTNTNPRVVFVVDDEVTVADTTALVLRSAGFQVTTFYDGSQVLSHAPEVPPDVVVTDFAMPGMDGLKLVSWLGEHHPSCRIVMMSAYDISVERLNGNPRIALLTKPVPPRLLIATVNGA